LNLKSSSRPLQTWQVFSKLFGKDLKARFNDEWKEYQNANPEATSTQDRFKFHSEKMQQWYDEADSEKQKEVEEFLRKSKGDLLEGGDVDPNRLFQE
jgi:hypothetical protein